MKQVYPAVADGLILRSKQRPMGAAHAYVYKW